MASVNRVTIIGHTGRDPELRYLPSGEAVATFSVATTETWKDKQGGKQERTDWHRVEFIRRTAEVCGDHLNKGAPVYIEGRMQYDKWTDKEGVEKTMTKIRGDRMQMLGGKSDGERSTRPEPSEPKPDAPRKQKLDDFEDDIPFN